jgi:hypothetical protein
LIFPKKSSGGKEKMSDLLCLAAAHGVEYKEVYWRKEHNTIQYNTIQYKSLRKMLRE